MFKYINPGYNVGDIANMTTTAIADASYGGKVYLTGDGKLYFPANTKEIYFCGSFNDDKTGSPYYIGTSGEFCFYNASGKKATGLEFHGANYTAEFYVWLSGNKAQTTARNPDGKLRRVYMKIKSDSQNGELKIYIDGALFYEFTGNVMGGDDIGYLKLYAETNYGKPSRIADIIVSDTEFSLNEKVIALSPLNTTTTMTDNGDGTYTATEVGQTLMQTINTSQLQTDIGANNKITGFSLIGSPAYYEGDGLQTLTAMQGHTEKEDIALASVNTNKILSSWAENLEQRELANISLGWKSKT